MDKSVFKYPDTNSSRAEITFLNERFKHLRIAIIGMGGTGSYILDLVAKTPVSEIHIFDDDYFLLHNAFRAPGAADGAVLDNEDGIKKVDYFFEIYSRLHSGLVKHCKKVTSDSLLELKGFDFVFISVDKNASRAMLTKGLLSIGVDFIDVGLGVNRVENSLIASMRVTAASREKNDHLAYRIGEEETEANEYATNIQIADLNCMNAVLAVIKWKKYVGFYQDLKKEHNILYFSNTNKMLNEDYTA